MLRRYTVMPVTVLFMEVKWALQNHRTKPCNNGEMAETYLSAFSCAV